MATQHLSHSLFLKSLAGEKVTTPPIWFMRQAGRYLPEYKKTRAQAGSFEALMSTPALAAEVTLQPLRRYDFDAAIVFSDILVIPKALGQGVKFEEQRGPVLENYIGLKNLNAANLHTNLSFVYDAVASIRKQMDEEGFTGTPLIGFAGAPFTLACYMIEGMGSKDFIKTRAFAYQNPEEFSALLDLLADAVAQYLLQKIDYGCQALQIFDSWAGVLTYDQFEQFVVKPTAKIVKTIRAKNSTIPIIGFPRGYSACAHDYAAKTGVNAVSFDEQANIKPQADFCVQGNLDPASLLAGTVPALKRTDEILQAMKLENGYRNFIFNLGHGIHKDTDPDTVKAVINHIRAQN